MNFDELVSILGDQRWFDLATVVQLTGHRRDTIKNQLCRWTKAGKVLSLRRGMYSLAQRYRQGSIQPAALANALYRPSYLSGMWALSFYGLIPESVPVYTSITTRTPRRFENAFGEFIFRNVKRSIFFGYAPVMISDAKVLIATPEKALVDCWYLETGEWNADRMREMRLSADGSLDETSLLSIVERIGKPRLSRALNVWLNEIRDQQKGEVEL